MPNTIADLTRETILREALQKIAGNYGGCICDHSGESCCENPAVGKFCPHCISELALARAFDPTREENRCPAP